MTRKKVKRILLSFERDIQLLSFIWKWKVATTHGIAGRFFPEVDGQNAYRRLRELELADLVKCKADSTGHKFLWTLTKRGFELIRPQLPNLREEGYGSEHPGHDLLCSAVLLCDFLPRVPEGIELFSEQELRRYSENNFPKEFLRRGTRTPDGYWFITKDLKPKTIALEVELNPKAIHEYKTISYIYNQAKSIDHVIWIVRNQTLINTILTGFSTSHLEARNIHSFILLSDFMTSGTQAMICDGAFRGQSIKSIINHQHQVVQPMVQCQHKSSASLYHLEILRVSKTFLKSKPYPHYQPWDFS